MFKYGADARFPTDNWHRQNYWADAVFTPIGNPLLTWHAAASGEAGPVTFQAAGTPPDADGTHLPAFG